MKKIKDESGWVELCTEQEFNGILKDHIEKAKAKIRKSKSDFIMYGFEKDGLFRLKLKLLDENEYDKMIKQANKKGIKPYYLFRSDVE